MTRAYKNLFCRSLLNAEKLQVFFIYAIHFFILAILEIHESLILIKWVVRIWILILGFYVIHDWVDWNRDFRHRSQRGDLNCPSTKHRPPLQKSGGAFTRFDRLPKTLIKPEIFIGTTNTRQHSLKSNNKMEKKWTTKFFRSSTNFFPSDECAEHLSMDHLYMSFIEYHWSSW